MRWCRHVVVCTHGTTGELAASFRDEGVLLVSCPFLWPEHLPPRPYRFWRWLRQRMIVTFPWRLARLLRQIRADLVHTHVTAWVDLQAKAIVKYARIPWVWTVHGVYSPDAAELARWKRAIQLTGGRPTRITADSHAILQHWRESGLGSQVTPDVVPVGVPIATVSTPGLPRPQWRRALGIPDDAVLYGTAGRMHRVKGHDVFIEAAAILVKRHGSCQFAVAGDGPLRGELMSRAAHLGLGSRLHFVGYQGHIEEFLAGLDVFVLPSRSEGMPLALIEAMAAGLPCVATRVGGVPEVLEDGCGLLVPPESPSDLANAMEAMLDEGRRRSMGARAAVAAQRFSIERCAERFAEIYRGLIEGGTAGT
jgi:glycosyltransferase involved in cell wall biosynthesis